MNICIRFLPRAPSSDNAGFISASDGDFWTETHQGAFSLQKLDEAREIECKTPFIFSIEKLIFNNLNKHVKTDQLGC